MRWYIRIARVLSQVLIVAAAFSLAVTCCLPWAHVTILHRIEASLPGIFFQAGSYAFAAAAAILLLLRRSPAACFITAIFIYAWTHQAIVEVPRRVKSQVLGAQSSLFPINRLLDQAHLPNIEIADWSVRNADLLSPAINWSVAAAEILLVSALLGIPSDPVLIWVSRRLIQAQCRTCGARWKATRDAQFCFQCGTPTDPGRPFVCPRCGGEPRKGDIHCVHCGIELLWTAGAPPKAIA